MPAERYWLWMEETQMGPFSIAQIGRMAESDEPEVNRETLYWSDRLNDWQPLKLLPLEWQEDSGQIARFVESDIEWVEYLIADNGHDCAFCLTQNGKRLRVQDVPSLPMDGCTCSPWPLAVWIAVAGP